MFLAERYDDTRANISDDPVFSNFFIILPTACWVGRLKPKSPLKAQNVAAEESSFL